MFQINSLKNISKMFIILGIISLIYWPKVFNKQEIFIPIRFELIFFLAIVAAYLYFLSKLTIKSSFMLKKTELNIYFALSIFLLSLFVATGISLIRYNLWFDFKGFSVLLKIILGISLFIVVYKYLEKDKLFYRMLCLAFYIPPLILISFLFYPEIAYHLSGEFRFRGLTSNPGIMAQLALISFSYLYILFLYNYYKKRRFKTILYSLLSLGMSALLLWTQTRSYLIGMIGVLIIGNILMTIYFKKKVLTMFVIIVLGILLISSVFFILPLPIKYSFLQKVSNCNEIEIRDNGIISCLEFSRIFDTSRETRFVLGEYYLGLIPENLLGLGVNFEQKFFLEWRLSGEEIWRLSPHSILDIWAYGGIFAILSIFYLSGKGLLNIIGKLKNRDNPLDVYYLGTGTAVIGLWISSVFIGSPILYMGFWILLAMTLV